MTTIRELFTEGGEFLCPECNRICDIADNYIDPDVVDGIGIQCRCGAEQEFMDMDEEVNEPTEYYGHRVGFTNTGILCCADCDMSHISTEFHDYSKAIYNLYRLGKYREVECEQTTLLDNLRRIAKHDRKI